MAKTSPQYDFSTPGYALVICKWQSTNQYSGLRYHTYAGDEIAIIITAPSTVPKFTQNTFINTWMTEHTNMIVSNTTCYCRQTYVNTKYILPRYMEN